VGVVQTVIVQNNHVEVGHRIENWRVDRQSDGHFMGQRYYVLACVECARERRYRARVIQEGRVPPCQHKDR
jgi:hypothetical protein